MDLRDRGLTAEVPRLFILDGGKALRSAVDAVYGKNAAVQRCRNHKVRNVLDHLPDKQRAHAKLVLRAAFNLEDASKGIEKLQQYAADLERGGWSSAAGSCARVWRSCSPCRPWACRGNCGGVWRPPTCWMPPTPARADSCGVSTWRDGAMAQRWVAAAMVETEKHFKKVHGYRQLWMLESNLKAWRDRRTGGNAATQVANVSAAA